MKTKSVDPIAGDRAVPGAPLPLRSPAKTRARYVGIHRARGFVRTQPKGKLPVTRPPIRPGLGGG